MPLTEEEYSNMRKGCTTEEEIKEKHTRDTELEILENVNTKNFLIGRTQETIQVPIASNDGIVEIEIRARLTPDELKPHKQFLAEFKRAANDPAYDITDEDGLARFLAAISTDDELDEALWLQVDSMTSAEILLAYFIEPARRMAAAQKFRNKK